MAAIYLGVYPYNECTQGKSSYDIVAVHMDDGAITYCLDCFGTDSTEDISPVYAIDAQEATYVCDGCASNIVVGEASFIGYDELPVFIQTKIDESNATLARHIERDRVIARMIAERSGE